MRSSSLLWPLLWPLVSILSWGVAGKALAQAVPLRLESGLQRQVSAPPPTALVDWLEQQIAAANRRDLEGVIAGYSSDFRHRDGLDREGMGQAIQRLWEKHPELTYSAEIVSWRQVGPEIIAHISSQMQGSQTSARGDLQVQASSLVRNRYRPDPGSSGLLLVEQEVLQESSVLTSGSAPPTVTFRLPDVVKPGSTYSVQAIVAEPLTHSLLLGAVATQPITGTGYPEITSFALEPLQAGGIFLQADAPPEPGAEWVSVMLVNQTGLTLHSQRLTVGDRLALEGALPSVP